MAFEIFSKPKKEGDSYKIDAKKQEKQKLFLQEIKQKGEISEKDLLLIKRRLNDGTYKHSDVEDLYDLKLTPDQEAKGKNYLFDKWRSPTGQERKGNPFGYREQNVLNHFSEIRFAGFQDNANSSQVEYGIKNYQPVYRVVSSEGSFEYYVDFEGVKVVG